MVIASTKRLILRELTLSDAAALFELYSDPEVMRFMGPPPASIEEERANIGRHREQYYRQLGFGLWAVELRATGELVGRCGLLRHEVEGRTETELSYLLARRHWGRGYATEAGQAVVRKAFEELRQTRLVAMIAHGNVASVRVAERLCFKVEGTISFKRFGLVERYARGPAEECP
ncbi:MAG TPA: GNAT family N-acetyltransferase [Rhodothermales bacterium]|nr:GNAT family N-acetyltransferase [Rhodothermales bacterium]